MTNEKVEPEVAASLVAQWSSMLDGKGPICSCVLINDEGVAEEIEVSCYFFVCHVHFVIHPKNTVVFFLKTFFFS